MHRKPFQEQGNFTAQHNLSYDEIMPRVSGSEWKIISLVIRSTIGYLDEEGNGRRKLAGLSYTEISQRTGIRNRNTISEALKRLHVTGKPAVSILIKVQSDNESEANKYGLNRDFDLDEWLKFLSASKNEAEGDTTRSTKIVLPPQYENRTTTRYKNRTTPQYENRTASIKKIEKERNKEKPAREAREEPPKRGSRPMRKELVPPHADLMQYGSRACGPYPNQDAQAGACRWLLENGYTVEVAKLCFDVLSAQDWRDSFRCWLTVKSEIGFFVKKNKRLIERVLARGDSAQVSTSATKREEFPVESDGELLERLKTEIKERVNPQSFSKWFELISEAGVDESTFCLRIPNEIVRDWIASNYFDVLAESLEAIGLVGYDVRYVLGERIRAAGQ